MSRFLTVVGMMVIVVMAGATWTAGANGGWMVLIGAGLVILLLTHAGAFAAGIFMARALIGDGAKVASFNADLEAKKAKAYSDVLMTGVRAGGSYRPAPTPAPAQPMLGAGAGAFVIEGMDSDYEAFQFGE